MDLEQDAYRYAIKNAYLHEGKADLKAVVGKMKALDKALDLKKAMPLLQEVVKKVNKMPFAEIEVEYKKFEGTYELAPKQKEMGLLPDLAWTDKEKVVTRFAPNPNGPFHLGNARAAYLSYAFAEKYKGKFILRFDDTDPKVKKPIENAEEIFREDLEWLGCKVGEVYYASDRLQIYYNYMRKLIEMEKAYVCDCEPEKWRKLITKKKACPCREHEGSGRNLELFEKMLKHQLKEGQAVLRLKTDLENKDPSVRDWWMARVVDNPEHPRAGKKHHLWPSYMFQSAIDDHELGATLIIRGQEHAQNQTKQEFIYDYFGWKYPHTFHTGRVQLEGMVLSKSEIMAGIEKGLYVGWDDPRLGTIRALRRRGFVPETIHEILLELGVKPVDASISLAKMADVNKKYIEPKAARFTFITEPINLDVNYCVKMEVEKDGRKFGLREGLQQFIVTKRDLANVKTGTVVRLRNAYNVRIVEKSEDAVLGEFVGAAKIKTTMLGWLIEGRQTNVMMADGSTLKGLSELQLAEKNPNEHVYFDKLGFCRIDSQHKGTTTAWFTHE